MTGANKLKWPLLLLAGLGPSLVLGISFQNWSERQLQQHGVRTTARITNDQQGRGGRVLSVSYFAGQKVHQGMLVLNEAEYRGLTDHVRVPVVYDSQNPAAVQMTGKQPRGKSILLAGLVLSFIGLAGTGVLARGSRTVKDAAR